MIRIAVVVVIACLAGCHMPAQTFAECVQQETKPEMSRHETWEVRRQCATKFPQAAAAASTPAVPHGNPLDQFDVQPPSTQPAAPKTPSPVTESPP
jgi:hypothetical protein